MNKIPKLNVMSMSCESEVTVRDECALRFGIFSRPPPTVEYVKAISALIGAAHVLAVFEENDAIKVFFDDRMYAETLLKSGIHVLGRHVRGDYVVPPGIKVILSNIDPVISNFEVMKLLSLYGNIVSPVVCPPICDDVEFCHIGYGVRHVYMVLEGVLPNRLELKQGDRTSYIKIKIEDDISVSTIKLDSSESDADDDVDTASRYESNPGPSRPNTETGNCTPREPVVVDVFRVTPDSSFESKDQNLPQLSAKNSPFKSVTPVQNKTRYSRALHLKRKRVTSATQAAKKIKQNLKGKWGTKRIRGRPPGRKHKRLVLKLKRGVNVDDEIPISELNNLDDKKFIMDEKTLKMFLEDVKHQRVPLELVKRYLGEDYDAEKLASLIDQLFHYRAVVKSHGLKLRIGRLINCLKKEVE